MKNTIILLISDPVKDAISRNFCCYVCKKYHLETGKIATVWNENFETSHVVGESCFDKLEEK
jgi:hypothetical protein